MCTDWIQNNRRLYCVQKTLKVYQERAEKAVIANRLASFRGRGDLAALHADGRLDENKK
jgi:hypothetical protein